MGETGSRCILILGGYGVFGGQLAKAMSRDRRFQIIVAGRDLSAATAFCAEHGGTPARIDRSAPDLAAEIAAHAPFAIIDAAGPFQHYADYSVAQAAVAAGAHYLDLSDDAGFASGIRGRDPQAKAAGVVVLSGVSSVPALSSAAVADLAEGMEDIHLIDIVILPGNRAPRGLSVIRAILAQVGRPVTFWRGDAQVCVPGWGNICRIDLAPGVLGRWASPIGAPDLALFPAHFHARSVCFRAGLELRLMHGGLWLLSLLVRARLVRNLAPLAGLLKRGADLLEGFGTDRGGMRVRVAGIADGQAVQREWLLVAPEGTGPQVPAIPAEVMLNCLLAKPVAPGARAALAEFPLAIAETVLHKRGITTHRRDQTFDLIFRAALGVGFDSLPGALRDLHQVIDCRRWQGSASISRGRGLLSRIAGWLMRFPKAGADVPVNVTMQRKGKAEVWLRDFAGQRFRSVLRSGRNGQGIRERFGPLSFDIALAVVDGTLIYPVTRGRILGLPLPRALLPVSETFEYVDGQGRACFDVALSHPLTGPIVHYRGWLEPLARGRFNP